MFTTTTSLRELLLLVAIVVIIISWQMERIRANRLQADLDAERVARRKVTTIAESLWRKSEWAGLRFTFESTSELPP